MRTILLLIYLTLSFLAPAAAQETVATMLQIGQEVPAVSLPVLSKDGVKAVPLADYRGRVVILEFWATYCGPCLPAMEHLSEIRSKFANEVEVFAITDEPRQKVVNFLNQRPSSLMIVLDNDRQLNQLFYHQFMPHTVVIGPDGYIKAITSPDEITEEVIHVLKSGADINLKMKAEYAPTEQALYLAAQQDFEDKSLYKVLLSPAVPNVTSQINKRSENEIEFINCTVPTIYQTLYQTTLHNAHDRPCLEVTLQTQYLLEEKNQYCFKLKVPERLKDRFAVIGMQHLDEMFAIKPKNEFRTRNVYALTINEGGAKKAAEGEGGSITIRNFIQLLWEAQLVDKPIVNESGLPDDAIISIELPTQVHEVSDRLAMAGLKLEPKSRELSCLILHDASRH